LGEPISVLLVDDNASFLANATRFLQEHASDDLVVTGIAYDGKEALEKAELLQPDIVLLDLNLPDLSGLDVIPRLRDIIPDVVIIVVTMLDPDVYQGPAMEEGADGFLTKQEASSELLPTIERVAQARWPGKESFILEKT
jgi:DNA-binding NarL/FixJ family response regulator